jgi:hypothetical protein
MLMPLRTRQRDESRTSSEETTDDGVDQTGAADPSMSASGGRCLVRASLGLWPAI